MARTIQSPGVEINEIDLSLRPALPVGTNILVPGFSPQGPTDEVLQVSSLSEFEQIYGLPTNAAERYFYHTVKATFQGPGNIFVSRLEYGDGASNDPEPYSALVYPVQASIAGTDESDLTNASIDKYELKAPVHVKLSRADYDTIANGDLTWSTSSASTITATGKAAVEAGGVVVLNHKSLTINEKFEGYYVGFIDTDELDPATAFGGIKHLRSLNKNSTAQGNSFLSVPESRLTFALQSAKDTDSSYTEGSVSEVMENLPDHDLNGAAFDDLLVLGVFKVRKSTLEPDTEKLDYVLSEYHIGSLNANREKYDPNGGAPVSYFLEDLTSTSNNVRVLVNKNISNTGDWVDRTTTMTLSGEGGNEEVATNAITRKVRVKQDPSAGVGADALFAHGLYNEASSTSNKVGAIPTKLRRVFELVDNHELFPLDLTLEAGLGTVFVGTNGGNDTTNYDDEKFFDIAENDGNDDLMYKSGEVSSFAADGPNMRYRAVANAFVEFAAKKRKDHMCILDPLKYIFVQGVNNKTLNDTTKNFSQHIYWPLRHTMSTFNTSYGATYGNWGLVFDGQLNRNVWAPMSGYIGAMYANTDSNFQPWFAPAGFTRGVLTGINDLAIYPKQKHRDQLYKINVNPVASFPNDGFVVFGQKTLQAKPSAFDRVNVRRLFLWLEKATRATVKYFVFEPNTLFTRTQVGNVLTPIFDIAKNTQGMYDYLLICDERNNTPDVIDQNEMVVDIYIKPVRAAEFILVNFYATRTGQDFSELVS